MGVGCNTGAQPGTHGEDRTMTEAMKSMITRVAILSACVLSLAACTGNVKLGPEAVKGKTTNGTVDMREVQAAYIGRGATGTGVLTFRGKEYKFQVGGVGIGVSASPLWTRRGKSPICAILRSSPGRIARRATGLPSARRARAISGCRTRRA